MKVLLIEPPFYMLQDVQPGSVSYGLAMLASMASQEGHEVKVFSPDFEFANNGGAENVITQYVNSDQKISMVKQRLDEILSSFQPRVVGISFWTARVKSGLAMARQAKTTYPGVLVVGGGIHATIRPDELLKSGCVDYVIRGEGELAFAHFLEIINKGKDPRQESIQCLSYINGHGQITHHPVTYCESLDDLPFPGYEHFLGYETFDKNVFQSIMFSRGCPFQCTYCASHKLWTRKTRFHSPSYTVNMIKHIHQKFGTTYFRFDDDTFTINKKSVISVCELIKKEQLPIQWHCDTRVELVSKELLIEMKDAGLESIAMGVESGDEVVRKLIKKTSSLEATRKAFQVAADMGIDTVGYFMLGIPGENYEQAGRTLDFIEDIQPTVPCISVCIPYPGTESYQLAVEMGTIKDPDSVDWSMYYHHSNINFSGKIKDEEWQHLLKRCVDIESVARKRMRKKQSILKRLVRKYNKKPFAVFLDLYKAISSSASRI